LNFWRLLKSIHISLVYVPRYAAQFPPAPTFYGLLLPTSSFVFASSRISRTMQCRSTKKQIAEICRYHWAPTTRRRAAARPEAIGVACRNGDQRSYQIKLEVHEVGNSSLARGSCFKFIRTSTWIVVLNWIWIQSKIGSVDAKSFDFDFVSF